MHCGTSYRYATGCIVMSTPERPGHAGHELSQAELTDVYRRLSRRAVLDGDDRRLVGLMSSAGDIPSEFQLELNPTIIHTLLYPDDHSITVTEAYLSYAAPYDSIGNEDELAHIGTVGLFVSSLFTDNPGYSMESWYELSDIDGAVSGQLSYEYVGPQGKLVILPADIGRPLDVDSSDASKRRIDDMIASSVGRPINQNELTALQDLGTVLEQ